MLLIPSDSPPELLRALARVPTPKLVLRAEKSLPQDLLLRFPLTVSPETLARGDEEAVLFSSSYGWIRWATSRGFRAVWYNPEGSPCPSPHPLHDREIRDLSELPGALRFDLPSLEGCLAILKGQNVPENVVQHSLAVAAVANFLAERLRTKGVPIDPLLAHRGALLHDLDKVTSLKEGEPHGERAARVLTELGYPRLGQIALAHVLRPGIAPRTWEEKVVFLADKMVEGAEVVGVERRLSCLEERYPNFLGQIQEAQPFIRAILAEVEGILGASERELIAELRGRDWRLPLGESPKGSP